MIKWGGAAIVAAFALTSIGMTQAAGDMHGVPKKYWEHKNPLQPTEDNLKKGHALYNEQCLRCHGPTGLGDGPDGAMIDPPPAPLAYTLHMPSSTDPFMFWSIREGGHQFDTDMPSFNHTLDKEGIWQVILYLRSGFLETK
ncbi:MAG: c-type cytochrome [Rhodospirillales bacterium]|nr:c-type cytochrome [Rhodospirillales bacterium]